MPELCDQRNARVSVPKSQPVLRRVNGLEAEMPTTIFPLSLTPVAAALLSPESAPMLTMPVACVQRNATELLEPKPAWPTTTLASCVMTVANEDPPSEPRFWKPLPCVHRKALRGPLTKSLSPTSAVPSPLMPNAREYPLAPLPEPRSIMPPACVQRNACWVAPLLKSE